MHARLSQIENVTLSSLLTYKPGDKRVDGKRGRREGLQNKPDTTDEHHPFRATAITEAQAALRAYNDKVDGLISDLDGREEALQRDLDERYATQRETLKAKYSDELGDIERKWGPSSAKHSNLVERATTAADNERRLEADLGRPLRIHLRYIYPFIMAAVALVELPINRFAFELYFSETPALSFLIALGVGVAIMMLAHLGGTWLKRSFGATGVGQRIAYIIGVVFVAALLLPTIILIAFLREHYVKFIEAGNVKFSDLINQKGVGGVVGEALSTDLGTQGWMLLMINLLVVGIAIIVAVVRHDSHPDYEKFVSQKRRLEARLTKLKTRHEIASARTKRRYDDLLSSLDKQQERIEREIEDAQKQRDTCVKHKTQMLERVAVNVKLRVQTYETENGAARTTKPPSTFWKSDESEIKAELENAIAEHADTPHARTSDIRAVK